MQWRTSRWRELKKAVRAQHCFLELQLLPLYGSAAVPNVKDCPLMEMQLSLDGTKAVLNAKDYPFIGTAAIQDYPFVSPIRNMNLALVSSPNCVLCSQ